MTKPTKTHYVTLRIVFDVPCDTQVAIRGAKSCLMRPRAASFHVPQRSPADPLTFKVARIMSDARKVKR